MKYVCGEQIYDADSSVNQRIFLDNVISEILEGQSRDWSKEGVLS